MQWFTDARLGMFIHWGSISLMNGCWGGYLERERFTDYEAKIAAEFNPPAFPAYSASIDPAVDQGPAAWAALAKEAGAKYMVLTTRHHDGFCLWDTQTTPFNSVQLRGRDFVREYVDACRAAGIGVGLYYSLMDWRFPGYWEGYQPANEQNALQLVDQVHAQVLELMTAYGTIDLLWADGQWFEGENLPSCGTWNNAPAAAFWRSQELLDGIRYFQPEIVINDRLAIPADYTTTEQEVGNGTPGAWEATMTIPDNDAWSHVEHSGSLKPTGRLIHEMVKASSLVGNFLLNIGPTKDGAVVAAERIRFQEIGQWMQLHGEALYGSQECKLFPTSSAYWTRQGNTGYCLVHAWPGTELAMPMVGTLALSAKILTTNQSVSFHQEHNGRLVFTGLPAAPPDPHMTVLKVDFESEPLSIPETDRAAWITGDAGQV